MSEIYNTTIDNANNSSDSTTYNMHKNNTNERVKNISNTSTNAEKNTDNKN